MIFADFYKGSKSPLAKLRLSTVPSPGRQTTQTPDWVDNEHADLMSKDKIKLKEAVKRYLCAKIKNDWDFQWPIHDSRDPHPTATKNKRGRKLVQTKREAAEDVSPHTKIVAEAERGGEEPCRLPDHVDDDNDDDVDNDDDIEDDNEDDDDDDDDDESVYSVVSEDDHFRPRLEWASELSDCEDAVDIKPCPSRGEETEARQRAVGKLIADKRALRRRANREEMKWNEGLACFEARRNAWTGARMVRVRSKPVSVPTVSPRSARCLFFRRSISGSPPASHPTVPPCGEAGSITTSDASSLAREKSLGGKQTRTRSHDVADHLLPVETLLPLAHPLLPPNNPLRATITPSIYLGIYDKVILNNLQPACPINLSDMLRACVAGWKRDGEWPPKSSVDPKAAARQRKPSKGAESMSTARRMSFGLLGRGGDEEPRGGKGIRRTIQKAFGFGGGPET